MPKFLIKLSDGILDEIFNSVQREAKDSFVRQCQELIQDVAIERDIVDVEQECFSSLYEKYDEMLGKFSQHSTETFQLTPESYQLIRMAVFNPEYLITHMEFTDEDFTLLIDEIVRLQELALVKTVDALL